MNLTRILPDHAKTPFGLWDGTHFAFNSSQNDILTAGKLLWRYGREFLKLRSHIKRFLTQFEQIYAFQDQGRAFRTPEEMLTAMGLYNLTQHSFEAFLTEVPPSLSPPSLLRSMEPTHSQRLKDVMRRTPLDSLSPDRSSVLRPAGWQMSSSLPSTPTTTTRSVLRHPAPCLLSCPVPFLFLILTRPRPPHSP